jgi:hypothetical protein
MSEDDLLGRRRLRAGTGKQPLVVRNTNQDFQQEVLERLAQLEAVAESCRNQSTAAEKPAEATKLDSRSLIALGAIALSIAGYVLQDARNSSRQEAEIQTTKTRVSNVERVAATNTEARIRSEVELKALRDGQDEIKQLLERHDSRTRSRVRQSQ